MTKEMSSLGGLQQQGPLSVNRMFQAPFLWSSDGTTGRSWLWHHLNRDLKFSDYG